MGWKRGYFYQSERDGDKVRTVYYGAGVGGEYVAARMAERKEARAALAAEKQAHLDECAALDAEYRQLRDAVHAHLTAAGMYQHNRGWRRRRG